MSQYSQCFHPIIKTLTTEIDGDFKYAVGYLLGVDVYNCNSIEDPIDALQQIFAEKKMLEKLLISVTTYYSKKLVDMNLFLRDNDCVTQLWKLYLIPQTSFVLKNLKRPLIKLLKSPQEFESLADLVPFAFDVLSVLLNSVNEFPSSIRVSYISTARIFRKKFPECEKTYLISLLITATYFLRILCPQIIAYQPPTLSNSKPIEKIARKRLINLAKLLQLVANNPKDIDSTHPELAPHISKLNDQFQKFCLNLVENSPKYFKSPYHLELSDSGRIKALNTIYNFAKEHKDEILVSLKQLDTTEKIQRPEDILWENYKVLPCDQSTNENTICNLPMEDIKSVGYEDLNASLPDNELSKKFASTLTKVDEMIVGENILTARGEAISKVEDCLTILNVNPSLSLTEPKLPIASKYNMRDFSNNLEWLQQEVKHHKFTILIFYRGLWCPFCKLYVKGWSNFAPFVSAMGGTVFAVSTEHHNKSHYEMNNVQTMQFVNDSSLVIANEFQVDNFRRINKIVTQPAIVCLNDKGEICYYWKCTPTVGNLFGGIERVPPMSVLRSISKIM